MGYDVVEMLNETLQIMEKGSYTVDDGIVRLKLFREEMETVHVLLPEDVREIEKRTDFQKVFVMGRCRYRCINIDSFAAARNQYEKDKIVRDKQIKPVLVLNLADPVNPGGDVRHGGTAQEQDLCRKSSLLIALESKEASRYYEYNRRLNTCMGSDAMIFAPQVEVIRDEKGNLLKDTIVVAVLTCAAYFGYTHLVLGAWGCGAFGNDAHVMSDIFFKVLKEFEFNNMCEKDFFRIIDFAVLDKTLEQYNFKEFNRNFNDF